MSLLLSFPGVSSAFELYSRKFVIERGPCNKEGYRVGSWLTYRSQSAVGEEKDSGRDFVDGVDERLLLGEGVRVEEPDSTRLLSKVELLMDGAEQSWNWLCLAGTHFL